MAHMPETASLAEFSKLLHSPTGCVRIATDHRGTWVCVLARPANPPVAGNHRGWVHRFRTWLAAWLVGRPDSGHNGPCAELDAGIPSSALPQAPVARFLAEIRSGALGLPAVPARTEDIYAALLIWWDRNGIDAVPSMRYFCAELAVLDVPVARKRYDDGGGIKGPHSIAYLGALAPGGNPVERYGQSVAQFRAALAQYSGHE